MSCSFIHSTKRVFQFSIKLNNKWSFVENKKINSFKNTCDICHTEKTSIRSSCWLITQKQTQIVA